MRAGRPAGPPAEFDAVVSCTASSLPIIGLGAVERALKARRHRPMFMVDLAVPRDIEPEVAQLSDVYLYTVDDLSALVQTAGEKRQAAVAQAEAIIETGVQSFVHWLDQRGSVPLIQALHAPGRRLARRRARPRTQAARRGEDVDAVLEALSRGLTQKMLHGTLAELHAADGDAARPAGADRLAAVPAQQRPRPQRRQALATLARPRPRRPRPIVPAASPSPSPPHEIRPSANNSTASPCAWPSSTRPSPTRASPPT